MGRLIIESKAACKGKEAMIGRDEIFQYVRKKYNVAEDYPLPTAPTFPVMRHQDTRKWFAIIMDVPKDRLGLTGQQRVDVINVKEWIIPANPKYYDTGHAFDEKSEIDWKQGTGIV